MLRVRKVKTKSGAIAVQVVLYSGHKSKIVAHIGSSHSPEELKVLMTKAELFISEYNKQPDLFEQKTSPVLFVDHAECIEASHRYAYRFLIECSKECYLDHLDKLFVDLALIRLIEPASKLRSLWLMQKYFGISYSERIYRKLPKLLSLKSEVEKAALKCATEKLNENCYLVLYDVTTLYFETHNGDELRIPGFSKDDKSKQPQIVIGLLVSRNGFPLQYEVFPGNTFEGKTMLPLLENFLNAHSVSWPVVVADAAMLSEENIQELKNRNTYYIVAARLANTSISFVAMVSNALKQQNGAIARFPSKHGDMICSFSAARYRKQYRDMNLQIKKAEEILSGKKAEKRVKFLRGKSRNYTLNEQLIEKSKLLLGIKGYCTNIPENVMPNTQVIERYGDLWRIEKAFRMSKSDLQTRPIFHRKEDAIKSHILICFTSLILQKYLEIVSGISLRNIRDQLLGITETKIRDNLTKKVFEFRSSTKEIMETPLAALIKKWKLPH